MGNNPKQRLEQTTDEARTDAYGRSRQYRYRVDFFADRLKRQNAADSACHLQLDIDVGFFAKLVHPDLGLLVEFAPAQVAL